MLKGGEEWTRCSESGIPCSLPESFRGSSRPRNLFECSVGERRRQCLQGTISPVLEGIPRCGRDDSLAVEGIGIRGPRTRSEQGPMDDRRYYTYLMASRSGVLYVGMTNNLSRRVREHKRKEGDSFTAHASSGIAPFPVPRTPLHWRRNSRADPGPTRRRSLSRRIRSGRIWARA